MKTAALRLGRILPQAGVFLLSFVSFVTTLHGMSALLDGSTVLPWLIAGAVTGGIQIILVWSVVRLCAVRTWWTALKLVPMLMVCYTISVGFAFGYWWHLFRAEDHAHERLASDIRVMAAPVRAFGARYGHLSERLSELANYSRVRAEEELLHGGTCGDGSPPGPGPRQSLRTTDAETFTRFAVHFDQAAGELSDLVAALGDAVEGFDLEDHVATGRFVEDTYAQAVVLRQDPQLRRLETTLQERVRIGEEGFTAASGVVVRCPDYRLTQLVDEVLDALDLPEINDPGIVVRDGSQREAIVETYARLFRFLGAIAGDGQAEFDARDTGPLILAAIVDLLILAMSMMMGMNNRRDPSPLGPLADLSRRKPKMNGQFLGTARDVADGRAARLSKLVRAYELRGPNQSAVIVPTGDVRGDAGSVRSVMDVLEALGLVRLDAPFLPTDKLSRFERAVLGDRLDGAEFVSVYRVPSKLTRQLLLDEFSAAMANRVPPTIKDDVQADTRSTTALKVVDAGL